jgi:hypothetical protein
MLAGERNMEIRRHSCALLFMLTGLAGGCISPKEYRPVGALTPLHVPPAPDATVPSSIAVKKEVALPLGTVCTEAQDSGLRGKLTPAAAAGEPDSGPCIAFVEYQPSGKRYDERQIESAAILVRKAIQDDPNHQPVIVGFVHGWKHNAEPGNGGYGQISKWPPEDTNIQGLEHILNFMYRCYYADPATKNPCLVARRDATLGRVRGHVVVGIYFGWYAANISPFWPVAQQMTVYSRGGEADKVARKGDLSADLTRLSKIAHPSPKGDNEPMFVLVGHSFGARLLEQAIEGPLKERLSQQIETSQQGSVPNFADLVLYVNSAAPARDGISMLDFLAQHRVTFRTTKGPNQREQPLLAAITTPADAATGIIFTVAMSPGSLSQAGAEAVDCFDPTNSKQFQVREDRRKLYRNTLGHLQEFQSHSLAEIPDMTEDTCQGSSQAQFLYWVPGHCFQVSPATPMPGQNIRWNGTPYWVISTDRSIIPDHGTIFTNRLMRFVGHVLPDERDEAVVNGK